LVNTPGYYKATWKLINPLIISKGAYGHFLDRNGTVIIIKILYQPRYPEHPPKVTSTPPIRDVCWDSKGVLHFALMNRHFVWTKYKDYSNPLIYLTDEITGKYRAM